MILKDHHDEACRYATARPPSFPPSLPAVLSGGNGGGRSESKSREQGATVSRCCTFVIESRSITRWTREEEKKKEKWEALVFDSLTLDRVSRPHQRRSDSGLLHHAPPDVWMFWTFFFFKFIRHLIASLPPPPPPPLPLPMFSESWIGRLECLEWIKTIIIIIIIIIQCCCFRLASFIKVLLLPSFFAMRKWKEAIHHDDVTALFNNSKRGLSLAHLHPPDCGSPFLYIKCVRRGAWWAKLVFWQRTPRPRTQRFTSRPII